MRLKTNLLLSWLTVMPLTVSAADALTVEQGTQLLREKMCLGCHQIEKKRVGPAFVDISERYRGDPEAALPMLINSIKNGGRGKWGAVPMPAQTQVTNEQAQELAVFILSLPQKPQ